MHRIKWRYRYEFVGCNWINVTATVLVVLYYACYFSVIFIDGKMYVGRKRMFCKKFICVINIEVWNEQTPWSCCIRVDCIKRNFQIDVWMFIWIHGLTDVDGFNRFIFQCFLHTRELEPKRRLPFCHRCEQAVNFKTWYLIIT